MMFVPAYPYHVLWCVTNFCNTSCMHCSSGSGAALEAELNTSEILRVMDQLAEASVYDIAFSGGEPLARNDIFEILSHARERGFMLGMSTNGLLLDSDTAARLKRYLSRLQISIDGIERTHDILRGRKGLFGKALRAIELSLSAGLFTRVCFTPNKLNYTEMERVIDLSAEMGVKAFNLSQYIPVGRGSRKLELSAHQWRDVLIQWEAKRREYAHMEFSTHTSQLVLVDPGLCADEGFIGCQAGKGVCCITPDGYLTPCVLMPLKMGSLREKSFKEIWEGSAVVKDLSGMTLKGYCGTCAHRLKCGGCRAAALACFNDYMREDPYCWLPTEKS